MMRILAIFAAFYILLNQMDEQYQEYTAQDLNLNPQEVIKPKTVDEMWDELNIVEKIWGVVMTIAMAVGFFMILGVTIK